MEFGSGVLALALTAKLPSDPDNPLGVLLRGWGSGWIPAPAACDLGAALQGGEIRRGIASARKSISARIAGVRPRLDENTA